MRGHTPVNGDGFGLCWYGERDEPGLYRDTLPAWSDPNLKSLVGQVKSGLFMAHVRASTGTATSRNNCHPFTCGKWSFMHNGQVGGYDGFRRHADMLIPDALYPYRKGATDSEALFLAALSRMTLFREVFPLLLPEMGNDRDLLRRKAEERLLEAGVVAKGDLIVLSYGDKMGQSGGTNTLSIVRVGDPLPAKR